MSKAHNTDHQRLCWPVLRWPSRPSGRDAATARHGEGVTPAHAPSVTRRQPADRRGRLRPPRTPRAPRQDRVCCAHGNFDVIHGGEMRPRQATHDSCCGRHWEGLLCRKGPRHAASTLDPRVWRTESSGVGLPLSPFLLGVHTRSLQKLSLTYYTRN
jgi:hypothetical protein